MNWRSFCGAGKEGWMEDGDKGQMEEGLDGGWGQGTNGRRGRHDSSDEKGEMKDELAIILGAGKEGWMEDGDKGQMEEEGDMTRQMKKER